MLRSAKKSRQGQTDIDVDDGDKKMLYNIDTRSLGWPCNPLDPGEQSLDFELSPPTLDGLPGVNVHKLFLFDTDAAAIS
jgi:hypothetical protein